MKKEDYMRLPKERLAELLEERDRVLICPTYPSYTPPCYAPDGLCTNPMHDCIGCPKWAFTRMDIVTKPNTAGK